MKKHDHRTEFRRKIQLEEKREIKSQQRKKRSAWAGLGTFGMIGWSVAIPTLFGAILGHWLDKKNPQSYSWTLALLLAGLVGGCLIAWNWVSKEYKDMHQNED